MLLMGNVVIAGTPPTGDTALPVANSIDATQDYLPIYTASATATQAINRNTLLGLSSAPVGLTDSQTLTNKTLTSPTISGPTLSGTVIGTYTLGGTPTFPSSVVTLTDTQTLTNKTLTSPTINGPNITNATLTTDAITGYTTSNSGTLFGSLTVTTGNLSTSGTFSSGAITSSGLIKANTSNPVWQYLGSASSSTSKTATNTTTDLGLATAITVPTGVTKVRVTLFLPTFSNNGSSGGNITVSIWNGTTGSGTLLQSGYSPLGTNTGTPITVVFVGTIAAGATTINAGIGSGSANVTANAQAATGQLLTMVVECC